jgi:hypothetical protein
MFLPSKIALSALLAFAGAGGLYRLYAIDLTPAANSQLVGLRLVFDCARYNSYPPEALGGMRSEVEKLLAKVEVAMPEISKSDAVLTTIVAATQPGPAQARGAGVPLDCCARQLKTKLQQQTRA